MYFLTDLDGKDNSAVEASKYCSLLLEVDAVVSRVKMFAESCAVFHMACREALLVEVASLVAVVVVVAFVENTAEVAAVQHD